MRCHYDDLITQDMEVICYCFYSPVWIATTPLRHPTQTIKRAKSVWTKEKPGNPEQMFVRMIANCPTLRVLSTRVQENVKRIARTALIPPRVWKVNVRGTKMRRFLGVEISVGELLAIRNGDSTGCQPIIFTLATIFFAKTF